MKITKRKRTKCLLLGWHYIEYNNIILKVYLNCVVIVFIYLCIRVTQENAYLSS